MFNDWPSKMAVQEIKLLTELGLLDEFVKAGNKIAQIVPLDSEALKEFQSLRGWLMTRGEIYALAHVDEWADLTIKFFLTINVPTLTGKTPSQIKSPWFKEGLVHYIKKHPTLCHAIYSGGYVSQGDESESKYLINTGSKKIRLTPKEKESVRKAGIAGANIHTTPMALITSILVSITIIYTIKSGISYEKDKLFWWVWPGLIIGIVIIGVGIGWSKIMPKFGLKRKKK